MKFLGSINLLLFAMVLLSCNFANADSWKCNKFSTLARIPADTCPNLCQSECGNLCSRDQFPARCTDCCSAMAQKQKAAGDQPVDNPDAGAGEATSDASTSNTGGDDGQ